MLQDEICIFLNTSDRDKEDGVEDRGMVINTGVRETSKGDDFSNLSIKWCTKEAELRMKRRKCLRETGILFR